MFFVYFSVSENYLFIYFLFIHKTIKVIQKNKFKKILYVEN